MKQTTINDSGSKVQLAIQSGQPLIISPIEGLRMQLETVFSEEFSDVPDVIVKTRKSDDPKGFQFLNLYLGKFEVAVEWKEDQGFGLSAFLEDEASTEGLFGAPNEWYNTAEATFHRIVSLVLEQRVTKPQQSRISEIRLARGISQESLSQQLSVKQATYSKLERRDDVKLSSLKRVIEAMGGRLLIQAVFADTRNVREIIF